MPEKNVEIPIPKKVMVGFYAALLALGLIIYFSWGLMYGSWNLFERTNLGMYAVTVMLCGFGIIGILLYHIKGKTE
ncbi:MAG: hypothetical protein KKH41_06610 [Candidatus Thermoplasmatota archaeon]|nr:hypothetical protein [Euryarchaeota archaeon]MBU4031412.1 hypothetical protein [Candidatus Thermoplasmatota archaeon]MBU4072165.1 hypothetical protein [Candidatus Thermoplasmatota archaeon]MBU4145315.1 hypothetical protein [Candidatus Thermoplasmatota archaeon]MBU4592239.1 hypothetical protein [Candidatus Thermoplasmatota archaeon]